jgi:hypothetical protein
MKDSAFQSCHALGGVLLALAASACGGAATTWRPVEVHSPPERAPETSLIKSDDAVMSDAEIHHLMSVKPTLPKVLRMAIFHLHHVGTDQAAWEPQSAKDDELTATSSGFVRQLRSLPSVVDASYLPRFVAPKEPSLGHVRQAAARYQADVAFVFTSTCQLYSTFKLFAADEAKAYCATDAALVDVRTGTIPFVARARRDLLLDESDDDMQLQDTVRRAELGAIDLALQDTARDLGLFFQRSLGDSTPSVAR